MSVRVVNSMIESGVIAAIFCDIRHAAEGPPKSRIKNSALPFRFAGGLHFAENAVPIERASPP
jgi:hypothetical protein